MAAVAAAMTAVRMPATSVGSSTRQGADPVAPDAGLFERPFYRSCRAHLVPDGVLASQTDALDPAEPRAERLEAVESGCRYYNRDIHRAAFAMPSYLRHELG